MPTDVKLPRLGQGMESGVIVRWLKSEGDAVKKGEPLYELDTDKVTQEVEAEVDGTLLKIVVAEGEVEVGATVAVIGEDGAAPAEAPPAKEEAETPAEATPASAKEIQEEAGTVPADDSAPARAGPAGRRAVDGKAPASRPRRSPAALRASAASTCSRCTAPVPRDGSSPRTSSRRPPQARRAAAPVPATSMPAAEVEVVQLTSVRKTIARRLTEAWAAPVFQLGVTADMSEALALREKLVERLADGDVKPTVNDVLVKLAAVALTRHHPVNATFTGEEIQRHPSANVGIAVAAPQGLVVPVIREAERLTVQEIARARADLVSRARDNKLKLPDLEGGTFTISNLGMFGVETFTAVLNPPQVAILAVGAVKDEAVVRDGELDVAPIVRMTLTCDHRAIDGADGAQFLQTLVALVEQPTLAL